MAEKGYFIIADITGYTAFLTGSELEHAEDILKSLFETLLDAIKPPLIVSNLQGDAVLAYAPEGSFLLGETLMNTIENIYGAFAHKLELMRINTTCTCRACANIQNLDLKIFVHHGEFIRQEIRGRTEISGSDVILVHRMTKNKVIDQTGWKAYALFSQAAITALGLEVFTAIMTPHRETYEHIGEVSMYVYNLRDMWEHEREKRRTAVDREGAWFVVDVDIPAPPSLVWDYFTNPVNRRRLLDVPGVRLSGTQHGRTGVGSTFHCEHGGSTTTDFTIVDWRPFEYLTENVTGLPLGLVGRTTARLTPTETGTRLSMIFAHPMIASPLVRLMFPIIRSFFRTALARDFKKAFETLRQNIADDQNEGRILVICAPEEPLAFSVQLTAKNAGV